MLFDLKKYYPKFITDMKDIGSILEVNGIELRRLYLQAIQVNSNYAIETCDLATIEQWEDLLSLYPAPEETIEERRKNIYAALNSQSPYTLNTLKGKLNSMLGADGYELHIDYNAQTLTVMVYQKEGITVQTIKTITKMLITMVPAHIDFTVVLGSSIDTEYTEYYGTHTIQANIYDIEFT